jgi:DNA adenine methylase
MDRRQGFSTLRGVAETIRPFLKWAGGKQRLLPRLSQHLPPSSGYERYLEPFLGSGAVFFFLQPHQAVLGDLNPELVGAYVALRDDLDGVIEIARHWTWDSDTYYSVRSADLEGLSEAERAARFIYLNRTGWNGLYRVNQKGEYNVPMGTSKTNGRWLNVDTLRAASSALRGKEIVACDYEILCEQGRPGDFFYLDPPYHGDTSFTKYTQSEFTHVDQERVADVAAELRDRGCLVMLTNSNTPYVQQLYSDRDFSLHESWSSRSLNSNPGRRGKRAELLVTSWSIKSGGEEDQHTRSC